MQHEVLHYHLFHRQETNGTGSMLDLEPLDQRRRDRLARALAYDDWLILGDVDHVAQYERHEAC